MCIDSQLHDTLICGLGGSANWKLLHAMSLSQRDGAKSIIHVGTKGKKLALWKRHYYAQDIFPIFLDSCPWRSDASIIFPTKLNFKFPLRLLLKWHKMHGLKTYFLRSPSSCGGIKRTIFTVQTAKKPLKFKKY